MFMNRTIYVNYADKPKRVREFHMKGFEHLENNPPSKVLVVHNVSPRLTNEEITELFKGCKYSYFYKKRNGAS